METITSNNNGQIKYLMRLMGQSSFRRREETFILEGKTLVYDSLGEDLKKIFVSRTYYNDNKDELTNLLPKLVVVDDDIISKVSDTKNSQGIFATARMKTKDMDEILSVTDRLLVIDRVMDPGNLGTIFRTAEAAGVDAILVGKGTVDIYNPKVVRSSMSSLLRQKISFYEDPIDLCDKLRAKGFKVIVSVLEGAECYREVDYPKKLALVIGNEAQGVDRGFVERADLKVYIDMQGQIESLNVSVAAAILLYEIRRNKILDL